MGPLFQLIFLGIFYTIISLIIGSILALLFWVILKCRKVQETKSLVLKGFFYPFSLMPYLFIAIIVTVFVCEGIRGVDAPLTDYWTIPVSDDTQLVTIDVMDNWNFSPVDIGESLSGNIASVAINDALAYGETESGSYYIYGIVNPGSHSSYTVYEDKTEFTAKLNDSGITHINYLPVNEYYWKRRNVGDLITLLFILVYPVYRFCRLIIHLKNAKPTE
ncbi:MAG: hypothetical protein ACRBCI_00700 [Cellvibrionaceae bacterium]